MKASDLLALQLSDTYLRERLSKPLCGVADAVSMEAAILIALRHEGDIIQLRVAGGAAPELVTLFDAKTAERICDVLGNLGLCFLHVPTGNMGFGKKRWPTFQAVAYFEQGGSLAEAKRLFKAAHLHGHVAASPHLSRLRREREQGGRI